MLTTENNAAARLRHRFPVAVALPGDHDWDEARLAFNLLIDQRPEAVARPRTAEEAAEIVAAARDAGLQVAALGSAHNAGPLGSLEGVLLMRLERMLGVHVDANQRIARVEAGARWWDVVPLAAEHGLAALHGSSPEINVVGYSLGGGIGWQARKHGLQANSIVAIEIVTADGELRRVDAENEADLFWALRGGGGNFGVVTAIEFRLYPVERVYAGSFFFPYERSPEVFQAWREWTAMVPEEVTSAVRMLQFPDLELIPEIVRGKSFAVVGAVALTDEAEGFELMRPLRCLGADMDTFATVSAAALTELHMDPVDPAPFMTDHALLCELPERTVDDMMRAAGPDTGSVLAVVELRHLGGALGREADGAGALSKVNGEYLTFAAGAVMEPEMAGPIQAQLAGLREVYAAHDSGRYLNFTEHPDDVSRMFPEGAVERLRSVKASYDPDGLFRANHAV